jgi:hypothetical protein
MLKDFDLIRDDNYFILFYLQNISSKKNQQRDFENTN